MEEGGESRGEFLHLSFFAGLGYTPCVVSLRHRLFYDGGREIEHRIADRSCMKVNVADTMVVVRISNHPQACLQGLLQAPEHSAEACEHCGRLLGDRGPASSSL